MKRRTLLVAGVGVLGGCLETGMDGSPGSTGTSDDDEANGTDRDDESNGMSDDDESNGTEQDGGSNGTSGTDEANGTDEDEGSNGSDKDDGSNGTGRNEDCEGDLIISEIYPDEVERDYISHEYVRLVNDGECAIEVGGFTIDYGNGNEYELSDLEVEPGARIVLRSYGRPDSVLESSPPIYLRSAGFGNSTDTSVMDGSGVVTLRNDDGDVIDEKRYDQDACRTEGALEIKYTCPEEVERKYISYEYLRIENTGECAIDVTDFTVEYVNEEATRQYTIPKLELEEGEILELRSRAGEDTWLDTDPRVYIHHAGFGDGDETSVMDGTGLVVLRDRNGDAIDDYEHDDTDDEACLR
ncbi:lamin tail domain-containing protein [Saliphagus infecundisoli]|uniref:Lamin tail domain-containing protein n=1 Tax=Saliphagus infecundisoli TaxID=1849069 RepID=A0ABD5QCU9_9EURY|nr:lamin tail domain-containing protein [Saliphagus infecundisoli]